MLLAQIYAVIALLVAFGVPQDTVNNVQAILEQQPAPITTSVPTPTPMEVAVEPIAASAAPSDVCVPNPVLNLSTTTDNGGNSIALIAQYSTGCPIPSGTTFSYTAQKANGKVIDVGDKLSISGTSWNYVSLPRNIPDEVNNDGLGDKTTPVWFVITVGTTTDKIQAQ